MVSIKDRKIAAREFLHQHKRFPVFVMGEEPKA